MKAPLLLFFAVTSFVATAVGQLVNGDGELRVTERGPHHRTWERQSVRTLANGRSITNRSPMMELETGMHYAMEGQWIESREEIELFQDGAIARQGQYQVIFAPNISTPGAIDLQTPDGRRMRSHVLGLGIFDAATGNSELIAEVKDSIGELSPPNEILYRDAFDGVLADLRYTYRKGAFEQDVIVREAIELPPGFNPATTRVEVWTEFVEAPVPLKTPRTVGQMADEALDFGAMQIGAGKAFSVGEERNGSGTVPIAKRWTQIEGRTFLIEAVPFNAIKERLELLPAPRQRAALPQPKPGQALKADAQRRPFPARRQAGIKRASDKILLAALPPPSRGLVLDYELVSSTSGYVFQCDRTYYVSGTATISGTATFEGGTVIKYANTNTAKIKLTGTVAWKADAYRPVILTARDDHSVGEKIGTNALSGYYATIALELDPSGGTLDIQNVRVSHATEGFDIDADTVVIQHAQFVHCQTAIDSRHPLLNLRNALVYDCNTAFGLSSTTMQGENITAHKIPTLSSQASGSSLTLTNCLLISATNGMSYSGANNVTNVDDTGIFQTLGAATHYLASGSTNRNAGTTNINSTLLTHLKKRTTYPPIVLGDGSLFTNSVTLYPQAQRDTDTPDLGYHYDPLDYVFSGLYLTNATLTAMPGVAIGTRTLAALGLGLLGGANFYCEGTPDNLNRIVRYNMVQEQSNTNWTDYADNTAYNILTAWTPTATPPQVRIRFTEFCIPASTADFMYHLYGSAEDAGSHDLRDCQFHAGSIWTSRPTLNVTNCLFNRTRFIFSEEYDMNPTFRNCTFIGSDFQLYHAGAGTWTFKDNLFDNTTNGYVEGTITHNYNAYTTNATRLTPNGANDVRLSVTNITYDTGWLGRFYLPTNLTSHSPLFNVGSQNSTNAGLYHYTMVTNQTRELTTTVDIGFHYVAVNSSGQPLDTDGDGLFDYFEDANGNGSADSGETAWNNLADWGLGVFITRPKGGTAIP